MPPVQVFYRLINAISPPHSAIHGVLLLLYFFHTENVLHNHLEKCKRCPEAIIEELSRLKDEHQAEKETKA